MLQKRFTDFIEYAKDNPEGYWFKAKWYGWGWTPVRWQGFLTLIIFILIAILAAFHLESKTSATGEVSTNDLLIFLSVITLSLIFLIFICYKKGEPPRWNWGDPREVKGEKER